MKTLQINFSVNTGSTGRIAEGIGIAAQKSNFESWIAYGRHENHSSSNLIRIGSQFDCYIHGFESRVFDNHGLGSKRATLFFLKQLDIIQPDLIHLHSIHGYYLNYKILFQYIREKRIPVVWTLHDCWAFTGHCAHFSFCGCDKWKNGCYKCPQTNTYPKCFIFDRSEHNYRDKKEAFTSISNLTIVPVSYWLDNLVSQSFLKSFHHTVVHNGINTSDFSPSDCNRVRDKLGIQQDDFLILGVAGVWSERKGLKDYIRLCELVSPKKKIILIGLTSKQIKKLPAGIIGIERTESAKDLAEYYSAADLFFNPTYEDTYPTTNLEAISCGTPCLTYRTGGSPESITSETGFVVPQGDLNAALLCIEKVSKKGKHAYSTACRNYALAHFRQEDRFQDYIKLYNKILIK